MPISRQYPAMMPFTFVLIFAGSFLIALAFPAAGLLTITIGAAVLVLAAVVRMWRAVRVAFGFRLVNPWIKPPPALPANVVRFPSIKAR